MKIRISNFDLEIKITYKEKGGKCSVDINGAVGVIFFAVVHFLTITLFSYFAFSYFRLFFFPSGVCLLSFYV